MEIQSAISSDSYIPKHSETLESEPIETERSRAIHLVDIENLVGTGDPTSVSVQRVRAEYVSQFVQDGDIIVLACSHFAYAKVAFAWPNARHLLRSGTDGTDLALLEVVENERVEERFDHVFIASGDGIFTDAAGRLGSFGVDVTVASRTGSLSRQLRLAANRVVHINADLHQLADVHKFEAAKAKRWAHNGQLWTVKEHKRSRRTRRNLQR